MLIYTLQFPQITLKDRSSFLDFTQKNIIELALKNQTEFLENELTAEYFHKDKKSTDFKPIRIHTLQKDGLLTLRAYGEKAVESLRFWLILFMDEFPNYCEHLIENLEHWELKSSEKPLYYQSYNWIPFNNCTEKNGCFYDKDQAEKQIETALQSRITGNLRTFLQNIGVDNSKLETSIILNNYPNKTKKKMALKTKIKGNRKSIYKNSFNVKVKTNIILPLYFSLGQNVGYGNGVFTRIM